MRNFEFNHTYKRWDEYRCFHAGQGPFVEFETGEVILTRVPYPDQRKHYDKYGLQLVSTSDTRWCPQLYLDKACTEEIKIAIKRRQRPT